MTTQSATYFYLPTNSMRWKLKDHDILVSYDVSSLLTNVPVDKTIESIAERAFKDDWFNKWG